MTRDSNLPGFVVIEEKAIRVSAVDAVIDGIAQRMTVGKPGAEAVAETPEKCIEVVMSSGRSFVFFDTTVEDIEEILYAGLQPGRYVKD
jgi:hypothetical protein